MLIKELKELYDRDLHKLKQEIELYTDESMLWSIEKSIKNSGGNLCLHIIGNLNTYIGKALANTNYIRQRELEFSASHIPRNKIYEQIDKTITIVNEGLSNITTEQFLYSKFPMKIWKEETGMAFTIIHLHSHLNYHLGQINYHRRIFDNLP